MIFEKDGKLLSLEEFQQLIQFRWQSQLQFQNDKVFNNILKSSQKLYKKGEMTYEQLWLGKYYKKELLDPKPPSIAIRWISEGLGWGVFALKNFRKMEFISEYVGLVRKREKKDEKNPYCFEYNTVSGVRTGYNIDAMDAGNISRFINHSFTPNLNASLATLDHISHVIIYAKEPIAKDTQLCYDYGPNYWSKRKAPIEL